MSAAHVLSRAEIIEALRKMGARSLAELKRRCRHYERYAADGQRSRDGDAPATEAEPPGSP